VRLRRPHVDLDGAVVVITGGSSGIGKATGLRLASRGSRLVLAARGEPALEATADECRARGAEALAVCADVSQEEEVAEVGRRAEEAFGRIDAWINGAGVMAYGTYDEVPMPTHRQIVQTNLLGPMFGAMEALERFRRQEGRGVIVNVASLYAEMTSPLVSSYVTSKFGLLGFSRVLRRDLYHEDDIAVCCVLPASIDTPIFRNAANHHGRATRAIPPVSGPDRVARQIVRCLEHPRKEVRIGTIGRLMAKGEVIAPPLYDRVVGPAFRFLGFSDEEQLAHDGNVFEPSREWKQIEGGWRNRAARRAALGVAAAATAAAAVAAARRTA
jgi:NAD(P)-dependent dehydrogenase (short-subunit alcohol dehydrogenase family)